MLIAVLLAGVWACSAVCVAALVVLEWFALRREAHELRDPKRLEQAWLLPSFERRDLS